MSFPSSALTFYLGTHTKQQMYCNITVAGVSNDAMTKQKEGTIWHPNLDSRQKLLVSKSTKPGRVMESNTQSIDF